MSKHMILRRFQSLVMAAIMLTATFVVTPGVLSASMADINGVLEWLDLGDTSKVRENLELPFTDDLGLGTIITWSSDSPSVIWDNGTVLRPSTGTNATVTLTATVSKGEDSGTKAFTVVVEAYTPAMRAIHTVHANPNSTGDEFYIEVPLGSAPKLPYRVWVVYNDGYAEWRYTKWPWQGGTGNGTDPGGPGNGPPAVAGVWTPSDVETTWKGYPVGHEYEVTGWITGTGSNTLGFPFAVNCKVVPADEWREEYVPSNDVVADQLPPGKVTITGQNRLTSDATRSIARTLTYHPDTYLWNYRDTFGLEQPDNVQLVNYDGSYVALSGNRTIAAPSGWENATTRLRGHGVGHYLSSLALAYGSNLATSAQQTQLRENMIYMIDEMRAIQELTFVQVPADHPNSIENGGSGYREASNVWPHYPADKATDAPDWKWPLLSEVTTAPPATFNHIQGRYWADGQILADGRPASNATANGTQFGTSTTPGNENYVKSEKGEPEWFGYGYLNAIPPLHPAMNEAYRSYSSWLWAPYYGWHKQLAGLMEIYYVFKDSLDPVEKATSDKALQICTDMSRWISDRLTKKGEIRDDQSTAYYGNMAYTWSTNISGEYGGANESIARCAFELDDDDPNKELLIRGSEMFNNKTYWDPLIVNSEIMSRNNNSHANSRIPNFPGVLWSYRGNADKDFYLMAKNHFDFNIGRYQYYNGGVGIGEWYKTPYTQISQIPPAGTGAETCCSYNLARLAKDLACFDPDNAEFTDQYERLFFNHLVGSLNQSSWNNTYLFFLGPGSNADYTRGATPGQSCCGGTSAETHVRYADATYLVSTDPANPTIWVNMYMPTEVTWDAAGVMVKQDCLWPAEKSTITVQQLPGQTAKTFDMKLRVPSWATGQFDIKHNGVSLAASYAPGTFFVIEDVTTADTIEVEMEFTARLDYAPDKRNNNWVASVFYGPMAMSFPGTSETWPGVLNINSDLSNIIRNGATDLADTAANTPGNNKTLYSMNIPDQPTTGNFTGLLRPSYYNTTTSTNPRPTHYFMVDLVPTGLDRTRLAEAINGAKVIPSASYTAASFSALQNAIAAAVSTYQSDENTQAQIDAQVGLIQATTDALVLTQEAKADLLAIINDALARKAAMDEWDARNGARFIEAWTAFLADLGNAELRLAAMSIVEAPDERPYAPRGYARMLEQLPIAQTAYNNEAATASEVAVVYEALSGIFNTMRPGYQPEPEDLDPPDGLIYGLAIPSLTELVARAKAYKPAIYTEATFVALTDAIANAEEDVVSGISGGSSTIHIGLIPDAIGQLQTAIDGLELNLDLPAPVITAMTLGNAHGWVTVDSKITGNVTATTSTNDTLTYAWSVAPEILGNTITDATSKTPTFKFANYGLYAVTVVVTDVLGRTSTSTINVSITDGAVITPHDLNRTAVYTATEGNIARSASDPNMRQYSHETDYYVAGNPGTGISLPGVNAQTPSNGSRSRILTINDGTKNQAAGTAWNNWGSAYGVESNPVYVVLNFGELYTIDSMRVEFTSDGNGYNSGTQVPRQAFLEYWNGTAWVRATNISRPADDPHGGPIATTGAEAANFVNDAHISGNGSIALANRPNWNKVVFDTPIETSMLRLHLNQRQTDANTNGIGVSEWEVFGVKGSPASAPKSDKTKLFEAILAFETLDKAGYFNETVYTSVKELYDAAMIVFLDNQESLDNEAAQAQTDAAADALNNSLLMSETVGLVLSKDSGKVTATLTYDSTDELKGVLILAAYDANGKLADIESKPVQFSGSGTEYIEVNIQTGYSYRAFVWDDDYKPLRQEVTG